MKSSFGKGANWRVTRLSGGCQISPFCLTVALLVIAVPSHAQVSPCGHVPISDCGKASSATYCPVYTCYLKAPFWRTVSAMGGQNVNPSGLAVFNNGTHGPGIISESVGYAMILAALYDDKATFDQLSATVQAGITANGNIGLFPWYWTGQNGSFSPAELDSASDADINIALAYVYADMAVTVYGWKDPSGIYKTMASKYIVSIRQHDFSTKDTNDANNHVLADGYTQAQERFSHPHNWHPDCSDIRAYQLFQAYEDKDTREFWRTAIDITKSCWKAIFNFGKNDKKRTENTTPWCETAQKPCPPPNNGQIDPKNYFVMLSNPTYQKLEAHRDYLQVKASRGGGDPQLYTSDSQRLPIRLLNYINAKINSSDDDMFGVANANLTALGTSFTNANYQTLTDQVKIASPWASNDGTFIQNFNAAGLFAYAGNYNNPKILYGNSHNVYNMLKKQFDPNNSNAKNFLGLNDADAFNASLTLWGLTVSHDGVTPLQTHILSLPEQAKPQKR
jgi:hypothetical protein